MSEEKTRAERLREISLPIPLEIMILFPPAVEALEKTRQFIQDEVGGYDLEAEDTTKSAAYLHQLDEALAELQTPIKVDFVGTLRHMIAKAVDIKARVTAGEMDADRDADFRDADAITSCARDLLNMLEPKKGRG